MKPHFIHQPELKQLPDGRNFEVAYAFAFWSPELGLITVPAKFKTDLASIPRLFWNLLPPFGKYTAAAVVHDYLYRTHTSTRAQADHVLLEAMKVSRVRWWQREVIYWNVRWFGFLAWNDDARRIQPPHHTESYGGKHFCSRHD